MNTSKKKTLIHGRKAQRGQGMSEYIIITALIAVAAIGVFALFGNVLQGQTASMASEMSGENKGGDAIKDAQESAKKARDEAAKVEDLGNYADQNESK